MNDVDRINFRKNLTAFNKEGKTIFDVLLKNKKKESSSMMGNLFEEEPVYIDLKQFNKDQYNDREIIDNERDVLGFNLLNTLGNNIYKIKQYCDKDVNYIKQKQEDLEDFSPIIIGALVTCIERKVSKKGNPFYFITINDNSGSIKLFCSEDIYGNIFETLVINKVLFLKIEQKNNFLRLIDAKGIDYLNYKDNTCLIIDIDRFDYISKKRIFGNILDLLCNDYIKSGNTTIYCRNEKTKLKITLTSDILNYLDNMLKVKWDIKIIEEKNYWYYSGKILEEWLEYEEKNQTNNNEIDLFNLIINI